MVYGPSPAACVFLDVSYRSTASDSWQFADARKLQTVTINALQSLPICDTCSPTNAERHRFENGLS